ncbi:MAG: sulfopyruvate decarboxylase subunit beta [Nitrospirae bacterium]|nr:sulfopyruvate decarboxylase subunit beta [Nitrospirota bacterium]
MFSPEEELIAVLTRSGVDFTCSLPCEKIKVLLEMLPDSFFHLPLTREEEGVGICAGAALSGRRPAIFVQSSGIGNMINALLSLTGFYELPLAIFVSQRGIYKERIEAQLPMGQRLPGILRGSGIPFSTVQSSDDFKTIEKKLREVFKNNRTHAFLLSPAIWEGSAAKAPKREAIVRKTGRRPSAVVESGLKTPLPKYTRFEILKAIAARLGSKIVVCNLGVPSKELYALKHQPSNFYMLGSMGMATPIALGISLTTDKEVVVIDGDGSLLMNPGTLATLAYAAPSNLTVVAIDNSSYGSTGNQPTLTGSCVDLEAVARGFGVHNTLKTASKKDLVSALREKTDGPRFIHVIAVSGNTDQPNIPVGHLEIKKQVQAFIKGPGSI